MLGIRIGTAAVFPLAKGLNIYVLK